MPNVLGHDGADGEPGLRRRSRCRAAAVVSSRSTRRPKHEDLFFIFKDLTSRSETYPAGRFLHAPLPTERPGRPRFQQRLQPALRVHRFRDLPAADESESAAGAHRGGRAEGESALTRTITIFHKPAKLTRTPRSLEGLGRSWWLGIVIDLLIFFSHGLCPARLVWAESLPPVSRRHDLRRPEVAAVGARRGRRAARSSSARSSTASTSSTPPTCIRVGASEEVLGRALRDFAQRDKVVIAHQGVQPDERRSERSRAVAQAHHDVDRSVADAAAAPTTSTSTRSIAWIPRRRSKKRCEALHDVVRSGKARYIGASSMFAWQFAQDALPRRPPRLDALRLDAESLQPGLSRGRARDAAALPRRRASA